MIMSIVISADDGAVFIASRSIVCSIVPPSAVLSNGEVVLINESQSYKKE
jgi:hypothetical protein